MMPEKTKPAAANGGPQKSPSPDIIAEPSPSDRPDKVTYPAMRSVVARHYPALADSVDACLSVFGAMALKGRTKPLSLIFEATSGYGKTAVLQMVFPAKGTALERYVYRSDKFTPKAFVTHAANVKTEDLAAMDLLPKLEDKVLVTKELAPIFRGREQEMQDNFSILISVLDGKGFTSDTGMRGRRGYERPILFNWLGATTPLPPSTHRLMSQLGTRLLFYEVPAIEPTEGELLAYAQRNAADLAERECLIGVKKFLIQFFSDHTVGSVLPDSITCLSKFMRVIVRWAQFLVAGRAEIKFEKTGTAWTPIAALKPEGPWKVVEYFKQLALGHALIQGRGYIDRSDLRLVGHVAISSIPGHVRPLVRTLRTAEQVDSITAAALCRVTPPTARNYQQQLALLGIADLKKGSPTTNKPDVITLASKYCWLKTQP